MLKIFRTFFGGYVPDYVKLKDRKYMILKLPKPLITISSPDQGFGCIKGTTKKLGQSYFPVPVCVFKRSTRQLLWETKSRSDGTYQFRNIAIGLECFVIAFDPNNQYNAVIQDKVVTK
ncbi:MAG TPA: hypothetical protein DCM30_10700 [Acinetobacter radioresistens]|nr:hypothetical protein [Acinetobacter radioresistens]